MQNGIPDGAAVVLDISHFEFCTLHFSFSSTQSMRPLFTRRDRDAARQGADNDTQRAVAFVEQFELAGCGSAVRTEQDWRTPVGAVEFGGVRNPRQIRV